MAVLSKFNIFLSPNHSLQKLRFAGTVVEDFCERTFAPDGADRVFKKGQCFSGRPLEFGRKKKRRKKTQQDIAGRNSGSCPANSR
jgi:hypothetical protein